MKFFKLVNDNMIKLIVNCKDIIYFFLKWEGK